MPLGCLYIWRSRSKHSMIFYPPPPLSFSVQTFIQGGPSPGKHGLGWFWFGMFHHPAWAVGSYSSGHQPGELPKSQSTQLKFAKGWATLYREEIYSLQNLLSRTQEGPGRTVKKEQEEISPNHVQRINLISVHCLSTYFGSFSWSHPLCADVIIGSPLCPRCTDSTACTVFV